MYIHKIETSSTLEASAVLSKDNKFSQKSSFEIMKKATSMIKHINITRTKLHVMTEEFAMLLLENMFSVAKIQEFLVSRKTNAQDALITVTQWTKNLLIVKVSARHRVEINAKLKAEEDVTA